MLLKQSMNDPKKMRVQMVQKTAVLERLSVTEREVPLIQRTECKQLSVEPFMGDDSIAVEEWLETVTLELFKGPVARWFVQAHSKTQEQDRNFEHLMTQLTRMYGSHESIIRYNWRWRSGCSSQENVCGTLLTDCVRLESLTQTSRKAVRIQKPTALSDAVQFAVENFGDYGEGYQVKQWQKAAALYRGRQHCNGLAVGEARKEFPGRNPVKIQHQDDDRPPRYDTRGRRLADQRNESFSPSALHAIAVAVRVDEAAVPTTSRSAIRNSNEADRIEGARRSGDACEVIQAFTAENEDQDADKKHSVDKQYKDGKNSKYIMDAMGMNGMVASYNEMDTASAGDTTNGMNPTDGSERSESSIGAVKLKHGVDTVKYKGEQIRLSGDSSAVVTK
ncbi:hypothetical protein PHYSODRAFT_303190 [Phytophthora sojae]|uniref:Uncharacterized protein n=1 Tax=Phytophthora sojae (strain P6497) TaxID=1094619 RepID=G4ZRA3_PHYSP|nr:hypothetical protein PHYSODRAFT_303190 [Phytophthora sojae]EGZ13788.1 hypothetical protein PHYSODRAFT_303190 [Phytophthora sojae]|eukprot:XP_009531217.1 hypothetical protein PHYSODRAFT_303190 [Phytophthora sojae]